MDDLQVLGEYHPSSWDCCSIGRELGLLVRKWGLVPVKRAYQDAGDFGTLCTATLDELQLAFEISVRGPEFHVGKHEDVRKWHVDGHLDGRPMSLVLWNSETPTEFLLADGSITQPKPFEVILANNSKVKHRMPREIGVNRWFFRQAVQTPEYLEVV